MIAEVGDVGVYSRSSCRVFSGVESGHVSVLNLLEMAISKA